MLDRLNESQERLQELEGERQRKMLEKAAREEAAASRRRALEEEREARLREQASVLVALLLSRNCTHFFMCSRYSRPGPLFLLPLPFFYTSPHVLSGGRARPSLHVPLIVRRLIC